MADLKQTLASVRDRIMRLIPTRNAQRVGLYQQAPCSIGSLRSFLSFAPARSKCTPSAGRRASHIPLHALSEVSAVVAVETQAAHVSEFSHGSGFVVYINGSLNSAARVALKINMATLELVRRLPLDELGAIGMYLSAAFADDSRRVDVAWAVVGSEMEREWREAERSWTRFSGGPYETFEMGDGPVMSSEEFDAMPEGSNLEDDSDWNNEVSHVSELDEISELGEVVSGRIW